MVGFDVGATTITQSNGLQVPLESDLPHDLIMRISHDRPHLEVTGTEHNIRPSHLLYADAISNALQRHQLDPQSPTLLAVPGWWTPNTVARVQVALEARDLNVLTVNEAEAAVAEHQRTSPSLPKTVVVVGLRAELTSAVIVRDCDSRPRALMTPTFVLEEGGSGLDAALLRHLVHGLVDLGSDIDRADPETVAAATLALSQCRGVRERLSLSTTESVDLMLPGAHHRVRVVRSELEEIVRPWVDSVVRAVISTLELSDIHVEAVLLSGGLATMPLVSQRLSAELGIEVHVPNEPRFLVARGTEALVALDAELARHTTSRFTFPRFIRRRTLAMKTAVAPPEKATKSVSEAADEFIESFFVTNTKPAEETPAQQPVSSGASA